MPQVALPSPTVLASLTDVSSVDQAVGITHIDLFARGHTSDDLIAMVDAGLVTTSTVTDDASGFMTTTFRLSPDGVATITAAQAPPPV